MAATNRLSDAMIIAIAGAIATRIRAANPNGWRLAKKPIDGIPTR
jgi:hypothetical protein